MLNLLPFILQTNDERAVVEDKLAELEVRHKGLQELIDTLQDGRGAQKVAEWHSKMESLRLDEVRHKRQIDKLKQQVCQTWYTGMRIPEIHCFPQI